MDKNGGSGQDQNENDTQESSQNPTEQSIDLGDDKNQDSEIR